MQVPCAAAGGGGGGGGSIFDSLPVSAGTAAGIAGAVGAVFAAAVVVRLCRARSKPG